MGCEDWKEHELFAASETASDAQPKQERSGPTKKRVEAAYSEPQFDVESCAAADLNGTYCVDEVIQRATYRKVLVNTCPQTVET